MKQLTRNEEIILLCVLKLDEEAYGVSIRNRIREETGEKWSFASIYPPLESLYKKGFVNRIKGDPLPERGGKSRYFYKVTTAGKKVLIRLFESRRKIWKGTEHMLWNAKGKEGS